MIRVVELADGTTILDASDHLDIDSVRAAQRDLAEWGHRGFSTVHVAGRVSGANAVDDLDSLGRVTVRLNIGLLVAVGDDAVALHLAAEHEGSWDGESLTAPSVSRAYDEIQPRLGRDTAVLVTGSVTQSMSDLVEMLGGVSE